MENNESKDDRQFADYGEIIQGSPEWLSLRLGKITASKISDLMAKTKTGTAASRGNYIAQLTAERLTGIVQESYKNLAMEHGTETEAEAREFYESETYNKVEQVGFINHPEIEMSGCSPDGLIGLDGGLEIKCPNTATHINTLLTGKIPLKYIYQIQWCMECSGRKWWDYISYDNRMPTPLRAFIKRIDRDQTLIDEIKSEVLKGLFEIDETIKKLENLK